MQTLGMWQPFRKAMTLSTPAPAASGAHSTTVQEAPSTKKVLKAAFSSHAATMLECCSRYLQAGLSSVQPGCSCRPEVCTCSRKGCTPDGAELDMCNDVDARKEQVADQAH